MSEWMNMCERREENVNVVQMSSDLSQSVVLRSAICPFNRSTLLCREAMCSCGKKELSVKDIRLIETLLYCVTTTVLNITQVFADLFNPFWISSDKTADIFSTRVCRLSRPDLSSFAVFSTASSLTINDDSESLFSISVMRTPNLATSSLTSWTSPGRVFNSGAAWRLSLTASKEPFKEAN